MPHKNFPITVTIRGAFLTFVFLIGGTGCQEFPPYMVNAESFGKPATLSSATMLTPDPQDATFLHGLEIRADNHFSATGWNATVRGLQPSPFFESLNHPSYESRSRELPFSKSGGVLAAGPPRSGQSSLAVALRRNSCRQFSANLRASDQPRTHPGPTPTRP